MLHFFFQYILLVIVILFLVMLAERLKLAYPIVLVVGGLVLSLIPGIPAVNINPESIFVIFLPPLLYEAAWLTSWKDLWRWRRVISSFAFPIVIVTSFVVAIVANKFIPGFSLALGFLLGGIVSPPDAVSATTVLKTVKVPKRLSTILEGESLLNDAASLIVFRFALAAVATGQFVFHEAALSFVVVIVGGILTGVVIGYIYYIIHRWLPTSPNMDIVLTLTAPYMMYIIAEFLHVSGVLAVVSGGLFLSMRSHEFLSYRSRLRGSNVWSTLAFVLNGMVFMLIGLSLPVIVEGLGPGGIKEAIWYGVLITIVLVVTRLACTLLASPFTVFMSRFITTADSSPGWKGPLIFGWAGMRGVVSLAAALSIPLLLQNGMPFPQRDMILFITFTVILLTLLVQGLTLPWVIRKVNMPDPDNTLSIKEQESLIGKELSKRGLQILDEEHVEAVGANASLQQLRVRFENDQSHLGIADSADLADYQRVYLLLLEQQREVLTRLNKDVKMDGDVIRKYQGLLDLEEEKLRTRFETE